MFNPVFLISLLSEQSSPYFECDYSSPEKRKYLIGKRILSKEEEASIQSKKHLQAESWEPFRIQFDLSTLYNWDYSTTTNTYHACTQVGQQVTWPSGSFQCTEADLEDSTKVQVLSSTLKNVEKYLNKLIKVLQ